MACSDYDHLYEALTDFNQLSDAALCPFTSDAGLGIGIALMGLFVFGTLGMGLTIRTQHPGPLVPTAILSAGTVAAALPGPAISVLAFVLFLAIAAIGIYIYSRARSTL